MPNFTNDEGRCVCKNGDCIWCLSLLDANESQEKPIKKSSQMPGRALTSAQKKKMLKQILAAWELVPELRLGQLLVNSMGENNLFYCEDENLAQNVESFAKRTK